MKQVKVSEATGPVLDWMVAKCEGVEVWVPTLHIKNSRDSSGFPVTYAPSIGWAQGGPIIEREEIFLAKSVLGGWTAAMYPDDICCILYAGDTPLVAAMRVYVASKMGDEVEVPDELV